MLPTSTTYLDGASAWQYPFAYASEYACLPRPHLRQPVDGPLQLLPLGGVDVGEGEGVVYPVVLASVRQDEVPARAQLIISGTKIRCSPA